MSTLRISNIEAKSVPASATIDEKVKITNSSGDTLVFIDGKTSGITTVGINTTDSNITFDANSNVVVTGIITATRFSGQITPTSLEIGSNIKLGNAGVITATSFVGSGANLTNLPSQVTINNATADRVLTSDGGTTLNGEANLTWNGTLLNLTGTGSEINLRGPGVTTHEIVANSSDNHWEFINNSGAGNITSDIIFKGSGAGGGTVREHLRIKSNTVKISNLPSGYLAGALTINTDYTNFGHIIVRDQNNDNHSAIMAENENSGSDEYNRIYRSVNRNSAAWANATLCAKSHTFRISNDGSAGDAFVIKSDKNVEITDGNLIMASGHGIDFSATGGVTSGGNSELFDDYEEGSFTATLSASGGGATFASGHIQTACLYVKIGSMVHVQGYFSGTNVTGGGTGIVKVSGLPFASNNTTYYTICLTHNTMTAQACTGAYIQYANTYFFPIQSGATTGGTFNVGNPRYMMFGGSYPVQF